MNALSSFQLPAGACRKLSLALAWVLVLGLPASRTQAQPLTGTFSIHGSIPSAPTWVRLGTAPRPRYGFRTAFDSSRSRLVLFGGFDGTTSYGDTWEFDGSSWSQTVTATGPSPRLGEGMAYDAARGRVVLFGGLDASSNDQNDTWEYDGSSWRKGAPSSSPTARDGTQMAYDAQRQKVVLFGGSSIDGRLSDTWEYDGTTWFERSSATFPPARQDHAMAYDSARGRVVLFGGLSGLTRLNDTWEWDGTVWAQRFPATSPPGRALHSLSYDPLRQRTVSFGGSTSTTFFRDTWEWDGSNWIQAQPQPAPVGRTKFGTVYDTTRSRIVLFGGLGSSASVLSDTWDWDGTAWTQRSLSGAPPARSFAAMAHDSVRGREVLFGGTTGSLLADTWELDGTTWTQVPVASAPPGRSNHALAFDAARHKLVLFGGNGSGGLLDDTWEYDGSAWTESTPATRPAARQGHGMAYDQATAKVTLFGGLTAGGARVADTWEWDGTNWAQRGPASSPSQRDGFGMDYDSARGRIVLFGGRDSLARVLSDTWEWNGTNWLQSSPATSPTSRTAFPMVFDSLSSRSILFGGIDAGANANADCFAWDGTQWTRRVLAASPSARSGSAMSFAAADSRAILFGGRDPSAGNQNDTWALPTSEPPHLTATISPYPPKPAEQIQLSATFSGAGGTPEFHWIQTFGPPLSLPLTTSATETFTTSLSAVFGVLVAAGDGRGGFAYAAGIVDTKHRPSVAVTASTTLASPGATVYLTGTASDTTTGPLTYAWTIASQPVGASGKLTGTASLTPTFSSTAVGTYTVSFTATNALGGQGTALITLLVDRVPVVTTGGAASVSAGGSLTLTSTAFAPDGGPLTYRWALLSGPAFSGPPLLITSPTASSTRVEPLAAGNYFVTLTVTDARGGSTQRLVPFTASPPPQPDLAAVSVSTATTFAVEGQTVQLTGSIKNSGGTSAPPSTTRFVLSVDTTIDAADPVLGTVATRGLAPQETAAVAARLAIPSGLPAGDYFVGMTADANGVTGDATTADNSVASVGTIRIATSPPATFPTTVGPGLVLLSVPIAAVRNGHPLQLADLAALTGSPYVVMAQAAAGNPGRFALASTTPGGMTQPVVAGQAYLMTVPPGGIRPLSLAGSLWPTSALSLPLTAGINLIGYPGLTVPASLTTAEQLLALAPNATLLARVAIAGPDGRPRFHVYLSGLTPAFKIQPGAGYLLINRRTETLLLPGN